MIKKSLLTMLLMALIAPWAANAQVTDNTWIKAGNQVPTAGTDVYITGDVTIPAGYTAVAHDVTIADGGSLTIEEGAQFIHTGKVHGKVNFTFNASNAKDDEYGTYRLIASPITPSVTVTSTGMIPADTTDPNYKKVDLYYFGEEEDTWINYKDPINDFSTIDITKGYLYSNPKTVHITFFGYIIPTTIPVEVDLSYTEGNVDAGVNLVGNPFTCFTYITDGNHEPIPYEVLDENGDYETKAPGTRLAPLKGAFVGATATGQKVIFTTTPPTSDKSVLNITVNQGRGMVDNAIINFGNNHTLETLKFDPSQTKLYMPVEGKDYAVASAENEGEMPICFKTEENGTYTINFDAEGVEFSYLHLIDNLTNTEVDLLEKPSYSFDARTTDYAARFTLVFATGNTNDDKNDFSFINDGNLTILGIEGEATLQIIDVTGRILSTETFNGSYTKAVNEAVNQASGVYMLRLIQGSDVRTQKIVIK